MSGSGRLTGSASDTEEAQSLRGVTCAYIADIMTMKSRPYAASDFSSCLSIFDSNVPAYFAPAEREQFVQFLQTRDPLRYLYFVSIANGAVVACHGLELDAKNRKGSFVWGMVDRALHGRGIGTSMTLERIKIAKATPDIDEVVLSTSQHTHRFYARHGFVVTKITPGGFGAGLDCYDMRLAI